MTQERLKLDVITRWNSVYDMIERIFENRLPLNLILIESKDQEEKALFFTHQVWEAIEKILKILKPFKKIVEMFSNKNLFSISAIFQFYQILQTIF